MTNILVMETQAVSSSALVEDKDPVKKGYFTMRVVLPEEEKSVFALWKDMSQKDLEAKMDGGENVIFLPMFWTEADREKLLDKVWMKYENATKFKVTDGKLAGYIGYIRLK